MLYNFIKIALCTLALLLVTFSSEAMSGPGEEEKLFIESYIQKVEFFLNKKKELHAKVSTEISVVSKTSSSISFSRSVFFDNNTAVRNIAFQGDDRRKTKAQPIVSDYESDGIFHSDMRLCSFGYRFDEKGETVKISYEKIFTDLKFLDPLYFNDYYEIGKSTVIIEVPEWLKLDIKEWNFDKEKPTLNSTTDQGKKIYTYTLKDQKGAFRFKRAPRRNKTNAHLILIPKSFKKDGQSERLMEDVSDLYGWYAGLVKTIGNDNKGLGKLVTELTAGKTNDLEKIKSIFYWVQDNIRYIAFENGIMGFKPESCQKVYNNKYGDCKGMANLTKEMLTIAGYDARLTWLGTNSLPYTYDIPSLIVDNHMICTVILDGEKIFLDATEKYADLYNYAYRIQGKQVLIEDGDKYIIETVPTMDLEKSKEYTKNKFTIDGAQLKGNGTVTFSGNRKTSMFYALSSSSKADWNDLVKGYVSNSDKNVKITLKTDPTLDNRDDDFEVVYDLVLDNHVIDLGSELYVNPETDYQFQNYEMPEERTDAFELPGTYNVETETTLTIPEGWKAQYLPEVVDVDTDNYRFFLEYKAENGVVNYHKKIEIKESLLLTDDFERWNATIEKIKAFYADQIILEKI